MNKLNFEVVVSNLKKYMKQKNKSLNILSKETEIPYTTLKSILDGETSDMKLSNAEKICKVLEISLDELMYSDKELNKMEQIETEKIKFASISPLNLDGLTIEDLNELQRIADYIKNKK